MRVFSTGLGAGVVFVIQSISKSASEGALEIPARQLSRCAQYFEDIFDFFNSPNTKFLVHSVSHKNIIGYIL